MSARCRITARPEGFGAFVFRVQGLGFRVGSPWGPKFRPLFHVKSINSLKEALREPKPETLKPKPLKAPTLKAFWVHFSLTSRSLNAGWVEQGRSFSGLRTLRVLKA